jgi:hypothetical protein
MTQTIKDFGISSMEYYVKRPIKVRAIQVAHNFTVDTLEGKMDGKAGDYLIEGVKGELYICKEDIFNMTYKRMKDGKTKSL